MLGPIERAAAERLFACARGARRRQRPDASHHGARSPMTAYSLAMCVSDQLEGFGPSSVATSAGGRAATRRGRSGGSLGPPPTGGSGRDGPLPPEA